MSGRIVRVQWVESAPPGPSLIHNTRSHGVALRLMDPFKQYLKNTAHLKGHLVAVDKLPPAVQRVVREKWLGAPCEKCLELRDDIIAAINAAGDAARNEVTDILFEIEPEGEAPSVRHARVRRDNAFAHRVQQRAKLVGMKTAERRRAIRKEAAKLRDGSKNESPPT